MPTASLSSAAVSLAFHALLLGVAAASSGVVTRPLRPASLVAALDGAIAVDTSSPSGALNAAPERAAALSADTRPRVAQASVRRALPRTPTPVQSAPAMPLTQAPPALPAPVQPLAALVSPDGPVSAGAAPPLGGPDGATVDEPRPVSSNGGAGAPSPASLSGRGVGGPLPGSAEAAADGRARLLATYLKGVRERVRLHREYPYLARRANLEGTVCLRVVIGASGRVLEVTPTCGTAQRPLLEAALASVSSAAPFPPLPGELGQRLTLDVPVVFDLD